MYFVVLILLPVYYCAQELFSYHHRRDAKHLEASHLNKSFGTCLSEHGVISHFLRLVNVYIIYLFMFELIYNQSKVFKNTAWS